MATPIDLPRPPFLRGLRDTVQARLLSPALLRFGFGLLRRFKPLLHVGDTVILSTDADVEEVVRRDGEFSVVSTNGARMDALGVTFVLGMDPSERYTREKAWLNDTMRADDIPAIRAFVRARADELLDAANGKIDAGGAYARTVALGLVEDYFGVSGPDPTTLMRWTRSLFWDIFLNLDDTAWIHQRARADSAALAAELRRQIAEVRSTVSPPDTVLARLTRLPGLDDDDVRRSISGVVLGAVDTTNKAFCQILDQLLRRPAVLRLAESAARAGDVAAVSRSVFEGLRFNPHNPFVVRRSLQPVMLASGREVPAGCRVLAATLGAMFDPSVVEQPTQCRPGRTAPDLHFGGGMHRCQGALINGVVLPELATALLARGNVRLATRLFGGIRYDGPFPDRFDVRFGPA